MSTRSALAAIVVPGGNYTAAGPTTTGPTNALPTATDIPEFNASAITTIDIQQLGTQVGARYVKSTIDGDAFRWGVLVVCTVASLLLLVRSVV